MLVGRRVRFFSSSIGSEAHASNCMAIDGTCPADVRFDQLSVVTPERAWKEPPVFGFLVGLRTEDGY